MVRSSSAVFPLPGLDRRFTPRVPAGGQLCASVAARRRSWPARPAARRRRGTSSGELLLWGSWGSVMRRGCLVVIVVGGGQFDSGQFQFPSRKQRRNGPFAVGDTTAAAAIPRRTPCRRVRTAPSPVPARPPCALRTGGCLTGHLEGEGQRVRYDSGQLADAQAHRFDARCAVLARHLFGTFDDRDRDGQFMHGVGTPCVVGYGGISSDFIRNIGLWGLVWPVRRGTACVSSSGRRNPG